jgi:hypothetical protein
VANRANIHLGARIAARTFRCEGGKLPSPPSGKQFSFVKPHKARFLRSLSIYFWMAAAALHRAAHSAQSEIEREMIQKAISGEMQLRAAQSSLA